MTKEALENLASVHRTGYSNLDEVAKCFRGQHTEFSLERIRNVAFDLASDVQEGNARGKRVQWAGGYMDDPKGLAEILLTVGFLLYKESRTSAPRQYDRDQDGPISDTAYFAVHPMFAPGLETISKL